MQSNGRRALMCVQGHTVTRDPDTSLWVTGAVGRLPENYVDACVTDPPYGIDYNGAAWDTFRSRDDFSQFTQTWARDVFRVLKPTGVAFVCCGQKSFAREFESAGFVCQTIFNWYFGTGLPLYAGGPQGASEVIIGMVKPDGRSIETCVETVGPFLTAEKADCAARAALQHGFAKATVIDGDGEQVLTCRAPGKATDDIYVPKVSPRERDLGCEDLPAQSKAKGRQARNHHPTTKPVKLMRILVRRASQLGGVVLDPFMGSGTTGMACAYEGRAFIGIENEEDYCDIARRRIDYAIRHAGRKTGSWRPVRV